MSDLMTKEQIDRHWSYIVAATSWTESVEAINKHIDAQDKLIGELVTFIASGTDAGCHCAWCLEAPTVLARAKERT